MCEQGIECKAQGDEKAQRWIDNSRGRLTTKSANMAARAGIATAHDGILLGRRVPSRWHSHAKPRRIEFTRS